MLVAGLAADLKRELLRLLDEDEEFRYAVAGRIGILEILKRLDRLEEGQNRLWEEVRSIKYSTQTWLTTWCLRRPTCLQLR
ncbi:MAG: hypothetical protein QXH52_06070 [Candidatus Caldarchaeum sp.]